MVLFLKYPYPSLLCDFPTIFGQEDRLEEISWIVQFLFDYGMDGTKLFGRPIASYPGPKTISYPPH